MAVGQDIHAFIGATFRSVWALELLCLLREHRDRSLSHIEMVAALRGSNPVVTQSVEALATAGLVLLESDGSARYGPASKALDKMVDQVVALYTKSPNAVRRAIVAAANPGLTAFADAFRLRKD
jgi:hypothetical protein